MAGVDYPGAGAGEWRRGEEAGAEDGWVVLEVEGRWGGVKTIGACAADYVVYGAVGEVDLIELVGVRWERRGAGGRVGGL